MHSSKLMALALAASSFAQACGGSGQGAADPAPAASPPAASPPASTHAASASTDASPTPPAVPATRPPPDLPAAVRVGAAWSDVRAAMGSRCVSGDVALATCDGHVFLLFANDASRSPRLVGVVDVADVPGVEAVTAPATWVLPASRRGQPTTVVRAVDELHALH